MDYCVLRVLCFFPMTIVFCGSVVDSIIRLILVQRKHWRTLLLEWQETTCFFRILHRSFMTVLKGFQSIGQTILRVFLARMRINFDVFHFCYSDDRNDHYRSLYRLYHLIIPNLSCNYSSSTIWSLCMCLVLVLVTFVFLTQRKVSSVVILIF